MGIFSWNKTAKRQALLDALETIPEFGKRNKSEILEMALEEFVKKHGISNNPQGQITQFTSKDIVQIPNHYEIMDNPKVWDIFLYNLKTEKEYKKYDDCLNLIIFKSNKRFERGF